MITVIANWMIETGLAVSILIVAILCIRRPFARAFGSRAAYGLWMLPVLRLVMPSISLPEFINFNRSIDTVTVQNSIEPIYLSEDFTHQSPVMSSPIMDWLAILLVVWAIGAVLWLSIQLLRHKRLHKQIDAMKPPTTTDLDVIIERAQSLIGLRQKPEIRLALSDAGPFVSGVIKPVIVLPRNFTQAYSAQQQLYALSHEMAHIKRYDIKIALAAILFRAMNWPNPIVHLAAPRFRADQEAACDAYVLKKLEQDNTTKSNARHEYAQTLVQAARLSINHGHPAPLGLTIHHPIKERLMKLNLDQKNAGIFTRMSLMAGVAACVMATAPLTVAESSTDELAGEDVTIDIKNKDVKVIKWVDEDDGERVEKHYEIVTENGETKAWEYDALGNKTEIDPDSIEDFHMELKGDHAWISKDGSIDFKALEGLHEGEGNVFMFKNEDGSLGQMKKRMRIITKGDGDREALIKRLTEDGVLDSDADREMIINKLTTGDGEARVFAFSSDSDAEIDIDRHSFAFASGGKATNYVSAAEKLVEKAENTDNISGATRKKLEQARQALIEAQEALEAETHN